LKASRSRGGRLAPTLALLLCCTLLAACENTDISLATNAAVDVVRAATLTDDQVREIAVRSARESDAQHVLAAPGSPYTQRLQRLVGRDFREGTQRFNVGVYVSPEVNAFAMADGTIRLYSGLMDLLGDGELQFVVGHEAGHVAKEHLRKKIQLAYAASALRKGLASQGGAAGDVAGSVVGGLVESLLNAQFSQLEEKEADDAGLAYLKGRSLDPAAAVSALKKLAGLGKGHSFLSSHPDPDVRAERLQAQIEGRAAPIEETKRDLVGRLYAALAAAGDFVVGRLRGWLP
jgi:putative metalloprotease